MELKDWISIAAIVIATLSTVGNLIFNWFLERHRLKVQYEQQSQIETLKEKREEQQEEIERRYNGPKNLYNGRGRNKIY